MNAGMSQHPSTILYHFFTCFPTFPLIPHDQPIRSRSRAPALPAWLPTGSKSADMFNSFNASQEESLWTWVYEIRLEIDNYAIICTV